MGLGGVEELLELQWVWELEGWREEGCIRVIGCLLVMHFGFLGRDRG